MQKRKILRHILHKIALSSLNYETLSINTKLYNVRDFNSVLRHAASFSRGLFFQNSWYTFEQFTWIAQSACSKNPIDDGLKICYTSTQLFF